MTLLRRSPSLLLGTKLLAPGRRMVSGRCGQEVAKRQVEALLRVAAALAFGMPVRSATAALPPSVIRGACRVLADRADHYLLGACRDVRAIR